MATKTSIFSSVISGSPLITSEKLVGSENYLSWSASVELWFMGQGYEDHLVTQEADIPEVDRVQWRKIDAQLCSVLWQSVDHRILLHLRAYKTCFKFWTQAKGLYTNDIQRLYKVASTIVHISQQDLDLSTYIDQIVSLKEEFLTVMPLTPDVGAQQTQLDKFFMVLTLIGLRLDLEPIRDQILGSSSVPSLDDVFARLLYISSTQTLPSDSTSDSSVLVSQTTSRGGRSGTRGRGQRPHCTYCNKLGHTRDRCYQLHGRPPRTAHMAQSFVLRCLSLRAPPHLRHLRLLLPLLPSLDLFSSITTTSALPTVTLANGSQLWLKDRSTEKTIGIGRESQGLYHLTSDSSLTICISTDAPLLIHNRLGHPSLSKFQKMVPRFSTLLSLPCESCQLGKHTRVSFLKRLNNRAKSPFELVHTDVGVLVGLPERKNRHLVETARTILLHSNVPFRFWGDAVLTACYLINHFRRVIVVIPLRLIDTLSPLAEAPADSLPIPSASPAPALPSPNDLPIAAGDRQWWMKWLLCTLMALGILLFYPSGKSIVGCRWVYAVKVGPDGQVDRLKARLVAKGYTQLDIKNVFLHGDLAEEVYMEQPPGFVAQGESGLVCRLRRSLYGLKQSPRAWFGRFSSVVQEFGMLRNDIVITGSDQDDSSSSSGVVLSQRKYTLDILEETGMLDCKPVDTPMDPNVKLVPGQGEPLGDPGRYRRLVGKLNYLTITRPNISFPVSVVSQFLQSPCDSHWDAVIRILRYIKSTPGQGVLYENRGHTQVVGYTDADWAGSPTDRRSTSGYCVFIGGNLISWKSKKQDVVARSSAEAKYRAMALATCELIWLRHLLRELRFGKDEQMKLICDNQAALHIASNPVFH
ncbi:Retrovirus-related Pol polyprotein from transposon RE2 [Vitis vinifera]|uniref:Retrovirus-related Pol polyprotein from transposon RE2 n=1 Tax=Vitis vinifera TaxID=29760 RepID=A0A438ILY1_VITVI|nr:Retrovirus-related Pol polyprotein from transposon RE2 [Vitis vinifera]